MATTVFVVDDNESFLNASCALLSREGLDVLGVASTGAEALWRIEELRPDVVLVDVNLAAESGFDLARQLVQADRAREPTVVLISTQAAPDLADLLAESPASGFVTKSDLSADSIRQVLNRGVR